MKTVKGLTTLRAHSLLSQYGQNVIKDREKSPIYKKFIEQIKSFLMILLIAAACVSFFIGEVFDATLILSIIFFPVFQFDDARKAQLCKFTIESIRDEISDDQSHLILRKILQEFFVKVIKMVMADVDIIGMMKAFRLDEIIRGKLMPG